MGSLNAHVILCVRERDSDGGDTDEDRDTRETRGWTSHQRSHMTVVEL